MRLQIPYGEGAVEITVPGQQRWETLAPFPVTPLLNPAAEVQNALRHPIGSPPLREVVHPGEQVAIVVNDITRLVRSDLFLPILVDELNAAGVEDAGIFVVFALGNHRPMTREEQCRVAGREICQRIRLFNHDCQSVENLVCIGRTSRGNEVWVNRRVHGADRVILTGEIIYHLIAGYSGGRKSLFPGVASGEFIRFNHRVILDPHCRPGVLDGNPAHEDLLEACKMFDPDFLLNVILSTSGELLRVVAGHYESAHRAGCEMVDQIYSVPVEQPYDLVIASAGGFPFDIDLRQAHKGMENACRAARDGGVLVFFAECREGSGSRAIEEWVSQFDSAAEIEQALRADFVVGGHKALWLARLGERHRISLVSGLDEGFVRRCHLQPVDDPVSLVERVASEARPNSRIAYLPHAGFTMPVPMWQSAEKVS
ncbi:MAG: nickel-dependent lactate racemase [Terriglobia bacterium]